MLRALLAVFALLPFVPLAASPAYACACCTNQGQRNVVIDRLTKERLEVIGKLRFAGKAELLAGERDLEDIKGIEKASLHYDLSVEQKSGGFVLRFRDENKNEGTIALARPETVSIFEVDPRISDGAKTGYGPRLYKEWRLTANFAGTGVFRAGNGGYQRVTLIFQGGGSSCTEVEDFTHWSLVVHGPLGEYLLFGDLAK